MKIQSLLYLALALPLMFPAGNGRAENTTPVPSTWSPDGKNWYPGAAPSNQRQYNNPNYTQPQQPAGPSAAQIAAQQQAAEEAAQRAAAERKKQEEAQKAADQAAFQTAKINALNSLKGISPDDLHLKSIGSGNSLGMKGIDDSSAFSGLKGLDDSSLQLKDAVADNTGGKKLFTTKNAIQDALSASAYGKDAINPDLGAALERAKVEINKKFDTGAPDREHFDTIVIAGDSGTQTPSQAQTIQVPVELQNDKRFQKLVIERDALQHQAQELGKQIQQTKADPAYAQDSKKLTKLDQLTSALHGVQGMAGYLNNLASDVVQKKVSIKSVDFSESASPNKGLDSINVPSP